MAHKPLRTIIFALAAVSTASCGGGGSSGGAFTPPTSGTPPPTPPVSSTCNLRSRQDWAFSVLNEWYLFPETLPSSLDPSPYSTVQAYLDALTATARAQRRDRFFTYITSIAEENAFFSSGSSAGFGVRLSYDTLNRRVFIAEAFEGAPALAAGIDRGAEIISIGTSSSDLVSVDSIMASQGSAGVSSALGPSTAGTTRVLRITDAAGTRNITVAKADYSLSPLSSRYGSKVIDDGGRKVAYINLRTFISTADNQLRTAFADFRAQGITNFIIDFRYNGGGLVSTAQLMSDLMGGNRTTADVMSRTTFRTSKSSNNEIRNFAPQPQSVSPVKVAFIGTGGTASASELVMNNFVPYLGVNAALVGTNTFGKPVGQIALDQATCDDRLRVIAFSTQNSANEGFYYDGMSGAMRATCRAGDDIAKALGDPAEASISVALDFIGGRSCTAISGVQTAQSVGATKRQLLIPDQPTPAQREVPGLF